MDPRLYLHNAVLGLAHPTPPWPAPLADAGYTIARIEQPVAVGEGGKVVVDLVFLCRERNALLAVEVKDGTVQVPQAQRYQALQPLDLIRTASITLDDPTAAVLDVAYAVWGERAAETVAALESVAPRAGVLAITTEISWQGTPPTDAGLSQAFTPPVPAELNALPRLMLADDGSPPSAVAAAIANEMHAAIVSGAESITVSLLLERVCWGWPRYGRAFQGSLKKAVLEMLRSAQSQELHGLIELERSTRQANDAVRFVRTAADAATQAGDVRGARAVRAKLDAFTASVTGKPIPPHPDQLDLLTELDDDDLDDDDLDDDD